MPKTIAFVTNQTSSDRLIHAAANIAKQNQTELIIVNILDSEYELDPRVVDEHFGQAKRYKATMRLLFSENKLFAMREVISGYDTHFIVTGMPGCHSSVLYDLWGSCGEKCFYTVEDTGKLIEVATKSRIAV